MKSVTQTIYDAVFKEAQKIVGAKNVYQILPLNADTDYPFVVVNDTSTGADDVTKSRLFQSVKVSIDIWGSEEQRKTVDDVANQLLNALIPHGLDRAKSSYQIMADTSTDDIFWRVRMVGVLVG